jgi:hypothetical protein
MLLSVMEELGFEKTVTVRIPNARRIPSTLEKIPIATFPRVRIIGP